MPPPAPEAEKGADGSRNPEALLAEIADSKNRTASTAARAQRTSEQQEADDRSHITRTVMGVLRWGVPITIGMLLLLSWLEPASAPEAIKAVVEIFKTVLLPVMTLVLGYYFGRGGKV